MDKHSNDSCFNHRLAYNSHGSWITRGRQGWIKVKGNQLGHISGDHHFDFPLRVLLIKSGNYRNFGLYLYSCHTYRHSSVKATRVKENAWGLQADMGRYLWSYGSFLQHLSILCLRAYKALWPLQSVLSRIRSPLQMVEQLYRYWELCEFSTSY